MKIQAQAQVRRNGGKNCTVIFTGRREKKISIFVATAKTVSKKVFQRILRIKENRFSSTRSARCERYLRREETRDYEITSFEMRPNGLLHDTTS